MTKTHVNGSKIALELIKTLKAIHDKPLVQISALKGNYRGYNPEKFLEQYPDKNERMEVIFLKFV